MGRIVKRISEVAPNLLVESEASAWYPVTGQQATISVSRVSETKHIPEHLESWYSDRWTSSIDYVFDDDKEDGYGFDEDEDYNDEDGNED